MENNQNNQKEIEENKKEQNTEEIIDLFEEEKPVEILDSEDLTEGQTAKPKRGNRIYNVVRVIALTAAAGVLMYASYQLTNSYLNYKEDEKKYAQINEMFVQNADAKEEQPEEKENSMNYSASLTNWVWDYEAMLKYNEEAKGYIKLDGTRIQYPIVEHSDNKFYLTRGSDKIYNGAGAIFLDYRTAGLDGKMCILYGHNMLDGSMFKAVMDFRNRDFCKKHQTFDVYVGYRHYIYYAFSTFSDKATNEEIYKFGFQSDGDFQKWIDRCYSKSTYRFDAPKPTSSDKVIMLSTCVDDNGNRQVVCIYRGEEVVD